jgi:hypothetical protein
MFDVKVHPFPLERPIQRRRIFRFPATSKAILRKVAAGPPYVLHPGKYSVELDPRNGLAIETLEIIAPPDGPFTQSCQLEKYKEMLPTPKCR